ncbi:Holliday junction resolvase RecU [Lysinibacillus sp. Bpr_S20]|uniref:Holliday junction resolvase RecU n=1 Tax=Lysinibacillus sp. Bpr_S20 TaxID=2933964 RepID=UPI00201375DF|nr:Holliday junction resolvase RecU [Lysinibacillus sp. Bpr_S20]MCL1701599.1 Holliday junction resolvase RecU [Lysinibacillus sp. Bpr_S20]
MQGRCIQAPEKSNLVEGEIYFLFPHGGLAYNVSKFSRPGSHFGTYQKSRFEVISEDATEVEEKHDEKYLARIVKPPSHFYLVGEEYIITEPDENGYYSVFFKNNAISFLLVSFRRYNKIYLLPFEVLQTSWEIAKNGGRKSIPYKTFENEGIEVKSKDGYTLHYLDALEV